MTAFARQAVEEGAELVISVGGDGTNNEVLNGLFPDGRPISERIAMSVIPGGTGGDFARLLQIPKDPAAAAKRLAGAKPRPIDVGLLTCADHEGATIRRMFLNIASFGLGGEVDARVNRTTKIFGGFASFFWASLTTLFTYKNRHVRLRVDDRMRSVDPAGERRTVTFGGDDSSARLDDGLDIVIPGISHGHRSERRRHLQGMHITILRCRSCADGRSRPVRRDHAHRHDGSNRRLPTVEVARRAGVPRVKILIRAG
jgi:hypothetical protein